MMTVRDEKDLEERIIVLESQLSEASRELEILRCKNDRRDTRPPPSDWQWPLSPEEYTRYGRQLIMPEIGLQGQLKLKHASVAIIGAGGLGCPAAVYLAGAGIGTLGLIDGDVVELSNLHRQIMHKTSAIGRYKVDSLRASIQELSPGTQFKCHHEHLTATNAMELLSGYDILLDCTDHPKSRYLISDAAVLLGISLVSASALRADGQITVLNHPARPPGHPTGGPCYRCLFPRPTPPESIVACGEGGILGPVVGMMGVMQALETIKILVSASTPSGKEGEDVGSTDPPSMLTFSAWRTLQFRTIKLRARRKTCAVCSSDATITRETLASCAFDYEAFCGRSEPIEILAADERIAADNVIESGLGATMLSPRDEYVLVDIRDQTRFELFNIDQSINAPFADLNLESGDDMDKLLKIKASNGNPNPSLLFICDRGNDSQLVVRKLKDHLASGSGSMGRQVHDVEGGWAAMRRCYGSRWPDI